MWCRTYCYHLFELFLLLDYPHPLILLLGCFLSIRIHLKCAISKWENFSIADKANKNETFPLQRILIIVTFLVSCSSSNILVFTTLYPFRSSWLFYFSLLHSPFQYQCVCICMLAFAQASEPTITLSIDSFHFNLLRSSKFSHFNFISFPIWFYSPWTAFHFLDTFLSFSLIYCALKVQLE